MRQIYLAGGCFWGTQHFFKQIEGINRTEVGYANGNLPFPTYEQVYTDQTGYAETVLIEYNPETITLEEILDLYFLTIDPTSLNKQGGDIGTRYRTGIYYTTLDDLPQIQKVYNTIEQKIGAKLAVEVAPLENFYPAELYHQDYLDKNPDGYCHIPRALIDFVKENRKNR